MPGYYGFTGACNSLARCGKHVVVVGGEKILM